MSTVSAKARPEPTSFTVTALTTGAMPGVVVYGPFDTEDEATTFAELCEAHGLPFRDASPSDVALVKVSPVYPATLDAVGYYFDLDN